MKLELTLDQARALKDALSEMAQQMNDDGNRGYFESSLLYPVYRALRRQVAFASNPEAIESGEPLAD